MKTSLLRSLFVTALLGGLSTVHAGESGLVDFGQFTAAPGCEFVEINLKPSLLKFAAEIVAKDEPETAELLRNVHHIRVNVVGLDDSNRADTVQRIEDLRAQLEKSGWEKIVTVRANGKGHGEDVVIFMKAKTEDAIDGLVVTVVDQKGEAVIVNIVGNIRPEQINRLADRLDIQPLRELKLRPGSPKTT